jgi:ATP-binding cassette subfamily C exporter for protease/lipase
MNPPAFFQRSELTSILWSFRREFLVVGFFSMVANLLMLAPTLYMLQVYDRVLLSQSELTLLAISLITLFFFGVMAFSEWMRSLLLVATGVRLDAKLGALVFQSSFDANLSQTSNATSRAFSDLIQIRQFITGNGVFAFFDAPWIPIYMVVLYFLHPWLGILGLIFALIQAALAWFGHRHTVLPSEEASKAASDSMAFLQGKLRNAEVLQAMGMVPNLQTRWAQKHQIAKEKNSRAQNISHRVTAWSKFVRYSQQSLALGAGALLAIDGQITMGAMIAASVLMTRALAPIDMMVGTWRQFLGMRYAFVRLEKMLQDYPVRDLAFKRVAPTGNITLGNVVATAPGRATPILQNIDYQAPAGSVTVVMGPSGSGKSTLARALLGIWPHISGEVLLDQLPVNSWNRIELGQYIGYLPQDIELLEGTIAENIARFGDLDSAKVIEAAKNTGLHEMILRFPKGYDTPTGEAGNLLSGGQRQRIGLARAIYGNPQLIVLDEPNANLDDVGEMALYQTVQLLKNQGKTVFLITHRPNALAVADRILLLQDGRVMASGPRDGVIAALQAQKQASVTTPATS